MWLAGPVLALDIILGAAVLVGSVLCLRPGPAIMWSTGVLSALWWPANNKVIEGPTLISLTAGHGLTTADLLGVWGFAMAAVAGVRLGPPGRPARLAGLAGLLVIGVLTAAGLDPH